MASGVYQARPICLAGGLDTSIINRKTSSFKPKKSDNSEQFIYAVSHPIF